MWLSTFIIKHSLALFKCKKFRECFLGRDRARFCQPGLTCRVKASSCNYLAKQLLASVLKRLTSRNNAAPICYLFFTGLNKWVAVWWSSHPLTHHCNKLIIPQGRAVKASALTARHKVPAHRKS